MTTQRFLFFGILPALIVPFLCSLIYFSHLGSHPLVPVVYGLSKAFLILWPLLWYRFWPHWKHPLPFRSVIGGILWGLIIVGVTLAVWFGNKELLQSFAHQIQEKAFQLRLTTPTKYIFFSIFLSLFHAFIEELYWRRFVFGGLLKFCRPLWAGLIASVGFGLHHFIVLGQYFSPILTGLFGFCVIIGGALWCGLYFRTRSLWGPWISHVMADAVIMFFGYQLIFG